MQYARHPHSYSPRRYSAFRFSAGIIPSGNHRSYAVDPSAALPPSPRPLRAVSDIPIFTILNSRCVARCPRPRNHIASGGSAGRRENNSSIGDFYGFSHTRLAAKSLKLYCGNSGFIFTIRSRGVYRVCSAQSAEYIQVTRN